MIRHIVFFSARDGIDPEVIRAELGRLGEIPSARRFEVVRNVRADAWSDEVDVVVYAEFPDEAAFRAYKAHPIYAETTATVKPLRDLRIAADFVSTL